MSEELNSEEKVIGIPKDKYLKFTYLLLIVSALIGAVGSFVVALASLGGLAGLAGLVLALLGFFAFKDKFNEQQQSHLKYICVLFLIFFVTGIVVGTVLGGLGIVSKIIILIVNLASLLLMFAGFKLNEENAVATKESVIAKIKS